MKEDNHPNTASDMETMTNEFGVPEQDEKLGKLKTDVSESRTVSSYSREEFITAFKKTVAFFKNIEGIDINRMRTQFEYVKRTVDAFGDGRESVIFIAPTGFGKSFYAYAITKLFEFLDSGNSSYILTPNKFLQEQYEKDIKGFDLSTYKMLKGQANYTCTVNKKPFTERECGDDSVSNVINSGKWKGCVGICPYIQERIKAIRAKTTVFNYNYWLTTLNNVYPILGDSSPFKPRTLTIFDETHTLGNIVQDMFAVEFSLNSIIRRSRAFSQMLINQSGCELNIVDELNMIVDAFESINSNIDANEYVYEKLMQLYKGLTSLFKKYDTELGRLLDKLPTDLDDKPILQDVHKDLIKFNETIIEWNDKLGQLIDVYAKFGKETIVASIEEITDDKVKVIPEFGSISKTRLKLQCTNESELCKMAVHEKSDYKVFMSATLGDMDAYAEQTGIKNYAKLEVPQIFNYDKSPIYSVTPMLSMNYRNKAQNKPAMVQRILKIIDHHEGQRGLIHTGNFELMRALQETGHPRIITYTNSDEKSKILDILKNSEDCVIAGPSLVEGVDLKDDLCRFMVFMKVPFLSMGDRLTKKKMEIYRKWYGWNAMSNVLQGLGRGIRNDKDWCVSYLLDSSFQSFFHNNPAPKWVEDRFKLMESTNIGVEYDPDAEFDNIEW
ncbi:DNA helicase [Tenacibaculum phage PTm1]|uniref:Rad3-related DNA helicase n=2 Tax=Shirahamavirus PTm1 TaxID=2846435 RepID=A0A5S9HXE3_9CAUD|nr:DNA helicase [Tenacibaculum phage PTm1]BBI90513.1 Rad3-related DNA helicase [Tenacibaculum phage PTm1]BBI90821.1 Rad3-related DNA helicase [Tenacibaculum phage PTm5]